VDLYEHQGKALFREHGIPVPPGIVATSPAEARAAAEELGGASVVKVQVQTGGRGKGGGVVLAETSGDAAAAAERMLRDGFGDMPVTSVLVEERVPIAEEFYAAILLDRSTKDYLAMVATEGGVDIEELARSDPKALRRIHVNPMIGMRAYHLRRLTGALPAEARVGASHLLTKTWDVLVATDATLVEINPLVLLEDGRVIALDAKISVDDNALGRQKEIERFRESFPVDPIEARAREAGLQYVKLEGEVGIIGNGAGLVMSTLDVVKLAGADAANFLDIGGGASADVMATSLELVLSDQDVRSVLVNIFGGITRCDLVAEGVLEALGRIDVTVSIVVRLDGTNAAEGRRILADAAHERIIPASTMLEAARRAAGLAGAAADGARTR
jgi:succinyl-CoA synthetase beta subunit